MFTNAFQVVRDYNLITANVETLKLKKKYTAYCKLARKFWDTQDSSPIFSLKVVWKISVKRREVQQKC